MDGKQSRHPVPMAFALTAVTFIGLFVFSLLSPATRQTTATASHPGSAVATQVSLAGIDLKSNPRQGTDRPAFVSPDGNWLLRGTELQSLAGQVYRLPFDKPPGYYAIYGSTPQGDVILMSTVNGAVAAAVNPATHAVVTFPFARSGSASTMEAARNRQGLWATVERTSTGAGPDVKMWVAVDGRPVPGLTFPDAPTQIAWSPDDTTLAIWTQSDSANEFDLYSLTERKVIAEKKWTSSVDNELSHQQLIWSPSGRYVAGGSGTQLFVYDTSRRTFEQYDIGTAPWTWMPLANTLCVLMADESHHDTHAMLYNPSEQNSPPVEVFQVDGSVTKVFATDVGLVVQTSDGTLTYVDDRYRTYPLFDHADVWWYCGKQHAVYAVDVDHTSTLWSISLPGGY
jgi:hypothetical protein